MPTTSMSLRPDSAMARRMLRPMRPNPLIPTRMVMSHLQISSTFGRALARPQPVGALVISLGELAQRRLGDLLGRDAEVPVKVLVRAAGAEAGHADEHAVRADDRVPALPHRG